MKFYMPNAYPHIFLHDCQFKIDYKNNNLHLLFENGFCKKTEGDVKKVPGYIEISNLSLDEITIKAFKGTTRLGKYTETVSYIDFSTLLELLEKRSLEVIDEYYCYGSVLYKCGFYPYLGAHPFDRIEIEITYKDNALEYYIEEDSL